MKEINVIGNLKQIVLCRFKEINNKVVILKKLSKEEEKFIDDTGYYKINNLLIPLKDIYFYGEVDLNKKEDIDYITKCNLIDDYIADPCYVPTSFDYDKGTIQKNYEGIIKHCITSDPVKWFKYCFCRIGKPNRVIAVKLNKIQLDGLTDIKMS